MPDQTDAQKFRQQSLEALESLRKIVEEGNTLLKEIKAVVAKAKEAADPDED